RCRGLVKLFAGHRDADLVLTKPGMPQFINGAERMGAIVENRDYRTLRGCWHRDPPVSSGDCTMLAWRDSCNPHAVTQAEMPFFTALPDPIIFHDDVPRNRRMPAIGFARRRCGVSRPAYRAAQPGVARNDRARSGGDPRTLRQPSNRPRFAGS